MTQTRRNPKARYVLPDVVNPPGTRCFSVPVPDNVFHVAAFLGQIKALASAYSWQDDQDHTALLVAAVWKDIFDGLEGCDVQTLLRMSGDCQWIEYSYDNGVSWSQLVNVNTCANAAITEAISDGVLTGPGQQPAGGEVPSNDCWIYNVELQANSRWLCPVPVESGYTVAVENANGGWADGNTITAVWACPNGTAYVLGACYGAIDTDPNDPVPTVSHMRLIGFCDDIYMDMYNTTYEVPDGTPQSHFFLQANDSSLSDNQGSIRCKVTVCNYHLWCYEWDFTTSQQGFVTQYGTTYETGQGFVDGSQPDGAYIYKTDLPEYVAEKVEIEFNENWGGNNPGVYAGDVYPPETYELSSGASGTTVIVMNGELSGTTLSIGADRWVGNVQHFGTIRLAKVRLFGAGINPFGDDNC